MFFPNSAPLPEPFPLIMTDNRFWKTYIKCRNLNHEDVTNIPEWKCYDNNDQKKEIYKPNITCDTDTLIDLRYCQIHLASTKNGTAEDIIGALVFFGILIAFATMLASGLGGKKGGLY